MKKFPKTLYVKHVEDNNGDGYFDPHTKIETLADAGETVRVGVYQLIEMQEARGVVVHKRVR